VAGRKTFGLGGGDGAGFYLIGQLRLGADAGGNFGPGVFDCFCLDGRCECRITVQEEATLFYSGAALKGCGAFGSHIFDNILAGQFNSLVSMVLVLAEFIPFGSAGGSAFAVGGLLCQFDGSGFFGNLALGKSFGAGSVLGWLVKSAGFAGSEAGSLNALFAGSGTLSHDSFAGSLGILFGFPGFGSGFELSITSVVETHDFGVTEAGCLLDLSTRCGSTVWSFSKLYDAAKGGFAGSL
jgi:hypothetical protein